MVLITLERTGREARPRATIFDSQSVKAAQRGEPTTRASGYDAGKKVKGVKRPLAADTNSLILALATTGAAVTDRNGAQQLLKPLKRRFSFLRYAFVDGGYNGASFAALAKREAELSVEAVTKPKDQRALPSSPGIE